MFLFDFGFFKFSFVWCWCLFFWFVCLLGLGFCSLVVVCIFGVLGVWVVCGLGWISGFCFELVLFGLMVLVTVLCFFWSCVCWIFVFGLVFFWWLLQVV